TMDFGYGHAFTESSPEAYERLLLDVLLGDRPLFPHQCEVELSWQILNPIINYWYSTGRPEPYRAGTWVSASADAMLGRDGRTWRRPRSSRTRTPAPPRSLPGWWTCARRAVWWRSAGCSPW